MKKMIILLLISIFLSCKHFKNNDFESMDINKYLIYFNHSTNEICLFNIDKKIPERNYKMEDEILSGAINSSGSSHSWFHNENDRYLFLLERNRKITKIYKIDLDNFNITEIFHSNSFYYKISIDGNTIYLLNYTEPLNGNSNIEKNYIVSHDLKTGNETIINYNELLPENEKIYATNFFVQENGIIFIGYNNFKELYFKRLYIYNKEENTINIVDEFVDHFTVFDEMILYEKTNLEITLDEIIMNGSKLYLYNLINNTCIQLPDYSYWYYFNFLIAKQNTIIYTDIREKIEVEFGRDIVSMNYWQANIFENKKELLFFSTDNITLLGVLDKN